jgi:AcrR family transcriptional regulator
MVPPKRAARTYRMVSRAEAAEQTATRIRAAAIDLFGSRPFADVTLQAIAEAAGVTLQTVLRRFGSKEQLFRAASEADADAVFKEREVPAQADVAAIVRTLVASYEGMGAMVWHGISQEDQFPLLMALLDMARARNRQWLETTFADAIGTARGSERERRTLLLFAATDFYLWKLYRRDLDQSREFTTDRITDLVTAALASFSTGNQDDRKAARQEASRD